MTCDLCFTRAIFPTPNFGLKLCVACIDELSELDCSQQESKMLEWSKSEGQNIAKIDSLFQYGGIVRSLTIDAKVKGDISSLNKILQIWSTQIEHAVSFKEIDLVMPCPSSLWSRMHGRIDIAWFLATAISYKFQIKFVRPPRSIYWNTKKRSQTERPIETNLVVPSGTTKSSFVGKSRNHCLIVDDVVTTGVTLRSCIEEASKLGYDKFSSITFARAR